MSQLNFEDLAEFLRQFAEKKNPGQKNLHYSGISASELENFLYSFSTVLKREHGDRQKNISATDLAHFLASFEPLLREDRKAGRALNIFDVFGLGHDEKKHCAFLAWLLNPKESHGHGGLFFHACFAHLPGCQYGEDILAGDYTVRTEYCPLGDMADRVDIVCEGHDFLCYIEAKIDAEEHGDQTVRYWKKLETCANGRKMALIYLADGSRPACDSAIPLSWKALAESLDRLREESSSGLPPFLHELVRQYAAFIRGFHEREGMPISIQPRQKNCSVRSLEQ